MVQPSVIIGILCAITLAVVLTVVGGQEPLTEVWLLNHTAYFADEPTLGVETTVAGSVSGMPSVQITTRHPANRTTIERVTLPLGYERNRSMTFTLRPYPRIEVVNGTAYATRVVSVQYFPAVQVRGLVGVRNREGRDVTYPYTVTAYSESTARQLTESSITLRNGQAVGVPVVFESNQTLTERTRIVFSLTNRSEQVQFWLEPGRGYRIQLS